MNLNSYQIQVLRVHRKYIREWKYYPLDMEIEDYQNRWIEKPQKHR